VLLFELSVVQGLLVVMEILGVTEVTSCRHRCVFLTLSALVTVHIKAAPGLCPVMVLAAWCLPSLDMEICQIIQQGEETSVYEGHGLGTEVQNGTEDAGHSMKTHLLL
jgi:hypothetical protein